MLRFPRCDEEHARALQASMSHGPVGRFTRRVAKVFGIVGVVIFGMHARAGDGLVFATMQALPWLGLAGLWLRALGRLPFRVYLGMVRKGSKQHAGDEIRTLSAQGFFAASPDGSRFLPWSAIDSVVETPEFILFYAASGPAHFIPKHAIALEDILPLRELLQIAFSTRSSRLLLADQG